MLASKKPGQTTDASLLVSGTLSDARLSANVALENLANVFTAKQSFSGTTHVGLCLNSLTTAEYNALTATNGDLFRDSTTDRIDARLSRGTVELVDTAGGQTINGALTVGGTLLSTGQVRGASVWFGGVSQANVKLYGSATGQLFIYNSAETAGVMINVTGNSAAFRNLANNADAPITCSNLTASGTVTASTVMLGDSTGPLLRNNAGTIEARNNANSAYTGIRCHGLTLGSNVSFPGTAITRQLSVGDAYNDGSIFQILNGATTLVSFSAANGISTGLNVSATNITASGTVTTSANGAASTPAAYLTGTWFSGGTGITNKPQLLIEPTGTTSTAWNTNGTAIGVNAANGFQGALADLKVNNQTLFSVNYQGVVSGSGFVCPNGWTYSTLGNAFYDSSGTLQRFRIGGTTYFTIATTGVDVVGNLTASGTITYSSIAFPELVTNGGFDTDTAWTKGTGWTISGGTAVATGVVSYADIQQNLPAVNYGTTYVVSFSAVITSGVLQVFLGTSGNTLVASISATGSYSFLIHKGPQDAVKTLLFRGNPAFTGTIDNVSVKRAF